MCIFGYMVAQKNNVYKRTKRTKLETIYIFCSEHQFTGNSIQNQHRVISSNRHRNRSIPHCADVNAQSLAQCCKLM